jgi:hypothetical protein
MVRENGVGKWRGLILTVGINQQHLRMFAKGVNQIDQIILMKIVNQDLWLGYLQPSNGAKSFALITLDFTIQFVK